MLRYLLLVLALLLMSGDPPQRKRKIDLGNMDDGPARKLTKTEEPAAEGSSSTNPWTGLPYSAQYFKILETRKTLPVWEQKVAFNNYLRDHQVIVLQGETGSGKTTQVRIELFRLSLMFSCCNFKFNIPCAVRRLLLCYFPALRCFEYESDPASLMCRFPNLLCNLVRRRERWLLAPNPVVSLL